MRSSPGRHGVRACAYSKLHFNPTSPRGVRFHPPAPFSGNRLADDTAGGLMKNALITLFLAVCLLLGFTPSICARSYSTNVEYSRHERHKKWKRVGIGALGGT